MDKLDVLVVYNASSAQSASVADLTSLHPFLLNSSRANYNLSYAYFLRACARSGLSAGLTSSSDIIGPGQCQNYWVSSADTWAKVNQPAQANHIFDKISPTSLLRSAERGLLLSDKSIVPFNDIELFATFFDKLLTYKQLPEYAIPTVAIRSKRLSHIESALHEISNLRHQHPYSHDFSSQIILKDRYGAGGNHIYKINRNFLVQIKALMIHHPTIQFVLQPFLLFDHGYNYQHHSTATDIRLIFHHNQLLQCYIRMAKLNDFRCNQHQGGKIIYVGQAEIPDLVHKIAQKLIRRIDKPNSLYALDFVISNSGKVYFLEGNIGPGISWDANEKTDVKMCKQLIRSIVGEFSLRIHPPIFHN